MEVELENLPATLIHSEERSAITLTLRKKPHLDEVPNAPTSRTAPQTLAKEFSQKQMLKLESMQTTTMICECEDCLEWIREVVTVSDGMSVVLACCKANSDRQLTCCNGCSLPKRQWQSLSVISSSSTSVGPTAPENRPRRAHTLSV